MKLAATVGALAVALVAALVAAAAVAMVAGVVASREEEKPDYADKRQERGDIGEEFE